VDQHWYRYLLAIRTLEPLGAAIHELERAFRDADPTDPRLYDGCIESIRRPRGGYKFVSTDLVASAFPAAPWLTVDHPEPTVGRLRGFLNFEWWSADTDARGFDISSWFLRSHGFLVDLSDGEAFDIITRRRWSLTEAFRRHGFGDGAFFLNRPPEYLERVRQILASELVYAGVEPAFITYGTHHNPLLVTSPYTPSVDRRFIDLWGYDWELLNRPGFRERILSQG
jgi:hypothetical protein